MDIENEHMLTGDEGVDEMTWENSTDIYLQPCVK